MVAPRHVFFFVCGHYLLGTRFLLFSIVRSCYGRHGGGMTSRELLFCSFFFPFPSQGTLTRQYPAVKYPHHTFFGFPILLSSHLVEFFIEKHPNFLSDL